MNMLRWLTAEIFLGILSLLISSCAAVYTTSESAYNISGIVAEQRTNGYVLKIEAVRKIGNVEAWIGQDNWLYITISDTSINVKQLNSLEKSPIVGKMHFFRYQTAVQVTLHLREKFDHIDVLRYPDDNNIYIALYQFKTNM